MNSPFSVRKGCDGVKHRGKKLML